MNSPAMPAGRRWLACIYTCAAHAPWLARFHASMAGQYLHSRPGTRVVEVVADPRASPPGRIDGSRLVASAEERYQALSVKTHRMIRTAVEQDSFDALLKIFIQSFLYSYARVFLFAKIRSPSDSVSILQKT